MLIWVYTCQNATLIEITCRGSFICYLFRNDKFAIYIEFYSHFSIWTGGYGFLPKHGLKINKFNFFILVSDYVSRQNRHLRHLLSVISGNISLQYWQTIATKRFLSFKMSIRHLLIFNYIPKKGCMPITYIWVLDLFWVELHRSKWK